MISKEKLVINCIYLSNYYLNCSNGCFFTYNNLSKATTNRFKCRVEFEMYQNGNEEFVGITNVKNIKLLNSFWTRIEKKLNLKEKTVIFNTNYNNVVILKVPLFWRENKLRKSIFTLLLRCGSFYFENGDNTIDAFNKYDLTSKCIPAIQHFLKGNVKQNFPEFTKKSADGYGGFVAEFSNRTQEELNKMLIKE